jgi:hypothetical protein
MAGRDWALAGVGSDHTISMNAGFGTDMITMRTLRRAALIAAAVGTVLAIVLLSGLTRTNGTTSRSPVSTPAGANVSAPASAVNAPVSSPAPASSGAAASTPSVSSPAPTATPSQSTSSGSSSTAQPPASSQTGTSASSSQPAPVTAPASSSASQGSQPAPAIGAPAGSNPWDDPNAG